MFARLGAEHVSLYGRKREEREMKEGKGGKIVFRDGWEKEGGSKSVRWPREGGGMACL